MIKKAPGIEDLFPDKTPKWNFIIDTAKDVFSLYNYREIVIPVLEYTELFSRGIGDETDIVSKEMFTFEDRGGRSLTLRPEGTASVVRAYVENGDYNRLSNCKLFYAGPMFRAERPQKGRLRQFNQLGLEFFGSDDPYYDFEVISVMDELCKKLGLNEYKILINSIGCPSCREHYIVELREFYRDKKEELCEDCKRRLEKNTLRLLDCKKEVCGRLKDSAPRITDFLCGDCHDHYKLVKRYLDENDTQYTEDPFLVRGLDYYTRTTFEFVTDKIGSQNAFAAGGRYDNLVETFDGKPTPAVGFAAGIERIFLLLEGAETVMPSIDCYIVHSGEKTLAYSVNLATDLRKKGISTDMEPETKGFKAQFKKATRDNARYAIIIGEEELEQSSVTIKNLETGKQELIEKNKLIEYLEDDCR